MKDEKYAGFRSFMKLYVADRKDIIKKRVIQYKQKYDAIPTLLILQVGHDFASEKYVAGKIKDCDEVGIDCKHVVFPEDVAEADLLQYIYENGSFYGGVLVQLPLPAHISVKKVVDAIPLDRDVDGFKVNSDFIPCTPLGIYNLLMKLFERDKRLDGKKVVIIGRSDIVGKPLAKLLIENTDATVTVCNSHTKCLSDYTFDADIVISAVGKRNVVTGHMVKDGVTIIDVGINRSEDNKVCGDVDVASLRDNVKFVTPVPGGVGLLTRISLLENVCQSVEKNPIK